MQTQTKLGRNLERLPDPIRAKKRFLLWRSEWNPKRDRYVKTPYYASGRKRHGNLDTNDDLSRLTTLDQALEAYGTGAYDGIGFALVEDDHFGAFDIDKCLTPEGDVAQNHPGFDLVESAAQEGAYIEVSPSGKGLRILGTCRIPAAYSKDGVEYWGKGRYVTLTGSPWANPRGWTNLDDLRRPLGRLDDNPQTHNDTDDILITPRMVTELRSALESMSSDERDLWVRMGHALKQLGSKGFELWDEWSAKSDKYDEADALRVWESLDPQQTNFRAVFAEAQREWGWENPRQHRNDEDPEDEIPIEAQRVILGEPVLHPTEFVLDGFLPTGVSLVAGAWGAGKSTNLIPVFASVAHLTPTHWNLHPQLRRKVIWITEAPDQARDTLYSLAKDPDPHRPGDDTPENSTETPENSPENAADPVSGVTPPGDPKSHSTDTDAEFPRVWEQMQEWFLLYAARRTDPKDLAKRLRQMVDDNAYTLDNGFRVNPVVVLDTTSANLDLENESDNSEVGNAMSQLKQRLPGVAVVLVGHTPKAVLKSDLSDLTFRGAGAWEADSVATYYLVHDEDTGHRFLALRKCRFTPDYPEISFGVGGGRELIPTPWGEPQSKAYVHGVPCPSQGDERRQAKAQAREEMKDQRKERAVTERQDSILRVVTRRTADQRLTWRTGVLEEIGGKRELVYEAINRLIESEHLMEVPVPSEIRNSWKGRIPDGLLLPAEVRPSLFFEGVRAQEEGA